MWYPDGSSLTFDCLQSCIGHAGVTDRSYILRTCCYCCAAAGAAAAASLVVNPPSPTRVAPVGGANPSPSAMKRFCRAFCHRVAAFVRFTPQDVRTALGGLISILFSAVLTAEIIINLLKADEEGEGTSDSCDCSESADLNALNVVLDEEPVSTATCPTHSEATSRLLVMCLVSILFGAWMNFVLLYKLRQRPVWSGYLEDNRRHFTPGWFYRDEGGNTWFVPRPKEDSVRPPFVVDDSMHTPFHWFAGFLVPWCFRRRSDIVGGVGFQSVDSRWSQSGPGVGVQSVDSRRSQSGVGVGFQSVDSRPTAPYM